MHQTERGLLLIAESYNNADMYHAIGFLFGDPVVYLRHSGGETLVCSHFERDEAAAHSRVSEVISFEDLDYNQLLIDLGRPAAALAEATLRLVRSRGLQALTVTGDAPVYVVDHLRANGIDVYCEPEAVLAARVVKRLDEIAAIEQAQRATERAMRRAIDLIAASEPRDGLLLLDGVPLTSERLREAIDLVFLAAECQAEGTIAACGADAASPHNRGTGPLRSNQTIVLDIFPRHTQQRYYADMTRTVSKGDPGPALQRMYDTTLRAMETAFDMIRPGANGKEIDQAVCRLYEDAGYATFLRNNSYPKTGYIHSLGHGVGLQIHEEPSLGRADDMLAEGHVITVEPGLYDPAIGAVRVEDLVVVTADGYRNLTQFEKRLIV